MILGLASMLGVSAGATAVSGFAWFTTTKSASVDVTNIGVYSTSSNLNVTFNAAIKGCANDGSSAGDVNIKAQAAERTQNFTGDGSTTTFTLEYEPSEKPTVKVDGSDYDPEDVSWTSGKVVTLTGTVPADGLTVAIKYKPNAVLTDISSTDGQTFYKPTWAAGYEGQYATAMPTFTDGYLSFSMNIQANGSSPLSVYVNLPKIEAMVESDTEDEALADLARVAIIHSSTTRMILQRDASTNNLGIDSDFTMNHRLAAGAGANDSWDLALLDKEVPTLVTPSTADKKILSTAPAKTAAQHWVADIAAGETTTVTVSIWLEGTSGNATSDASGQFLENIAAGKIKVSLPLIAF